jgi:hypothetical protein
MGDRSILPPGAFDDLIDRFLCGKKMVNPEAVNPVMGPMAVDIWSWWVRLGATAKHYCAWPWSLI